MRVAYDENTPFELVEIVLAMFGHECAENFCRRFAGCKVYVPTNPPADNKFSLILGHERALLLGQELGGVHMYVPMRSRQSDRAITLAYLLSERRTMADIAVEMGLSERTIYTLRRQLRRAERKYARPAEGEKP